MISDNESYSLDQNDSPRAMIRKNQVDASIAAMRSFDLRPRCFQEAGSTCRFDEVGKYLEDSAKFAIIHKFNEAVPASRRIPKEQGDNATYIFNRRAEGPKDGHLTPLVEYNPTLLALTSDFDPKLLNYLTGRYHDEISDEEADRVKYLSIARGANFHACGSKVMERLDNPTNENSYLSLSLLDENLQAIPGATAYVRLTQAIVEYKCFLKEHFKDTFQDYQIIAMPTTKGNGRKDQLFVVASDSKSYIFPIDIRRVPAPTNSAIGWDTKLKGEPIPMIPTIGEEDEEIQSQNLFYGRGLQIRLSEKIVTEKWNCAGAFHSLVLDYQKNYHFFTNGSMDKNGLINTYMEVRPHGMRTFRKVHFYSEQFHEKSDWDILPNSALNKRYHRNDTGVIWSKVTPEHQWEYSNAKTTYWNKLNKPRGTACCIDLLWGENNDEIVKVGISHLVSKERGYVSRFYAFEQKAPSFKVVATSGLFCLGGKKETDINSDSQIFSAPDKVNLQMNVTSYDCPQITFASGLADYQGDSNYAVLSYGVNDCYSRSIVISKERIREFLDLKLARLKHSSQSQGISKQIALK